MKKKIIFISEYIQPPYDEGIKKTAHRFVTALSDYFQLRCICRKGPEFPNSIIKVRTNRLFISRLIRSSFRDFKPDAVVYFPFASSTFFGFLRNFILSGYYPSAANFMIAMQPKPLKPWQGRLVKMMRPGLVLTPSPQHQEDLKSLGIKTSMLPLFTDMNVFKPVANSRIKSELRKKYGIPRHAYVISHVGHLNLSRNLHFLIPLQTDGRQVVVVGSSSTPHDAKGPDSLKNELRRSGILLLDRTIEGIHEIYQLSDLYVFPVEAPEGAIGMPLSVLEARACRLPVLTTPFGGLRRYLQDDNHAIFYANPADFPDVVLQIQGLNRSLFKKTKLSGLNREFIRTISRLV
jgi:glycosyltransferase involved in cell wall biosynthesis